MERVLSAEKPWHLLASFYGAVRSYKSGGGVAVTFLVTEETVSEPIPLSEARADWAVAPSSKFCRLTALMGKPSSSIIAESFQ